ncbi:MAG: serine hydrolase domain-containing protein [Cyclobacteriaceae bacterium]
MQPINLKGITLLLTAISYLLTTNAAIAQKSSFPSEDYVTQKMDALMANSDLPALVAIAINSSGEKIAYTYGHAIWGTDSPIETNNIFRIASMTKLLTSIAALQLVEQDLIALDEDLSKFVPEMADIPILTREKELINGEIPITLRHLLTHTSGFGYFFTDSLLATHNQADWEYEDLPRRFEAGTQFLYGTSTTWAGKLVERISDMSLEEYFRKHLTGPLEMERTWFNVPDSLKEEIVSYGRRGDDGTEQLVEIPNRIPKNKVKTFNGGGGLFSSPEDYAKLLSCLLNDGEHQNGRILEKQTIDEMFKPQLKDISMDISDNYYLKGMCCDFRGLVKPTANWGLAGLIDTETTSYGREKGTLL